MAVPTYEELMRPVLEACQFGEVSISDTVDKIAKKLSLSKEDVTELLPSGKQTRFSNRVNWAKSYLKQAGLVKATKRAHFVITDRGQEALSSGPGIINKDYLERFEEFQEFQSRKNTSGDSSANAQVRAEDLTPDESLREAHRRLNDALASDLLDRVRDGTPSFFEGLIVDLLVAMGYGGSSEGMGEALVVGGPGDDGIDGIIDQDPLGLDQVYVQAKRYKDGNVVGARDIRDFYGALSMKKAVKGIFLTASSFSSSAIDTAKSLDKRMVLIDGKLLAKLMTQYNIGCRDEEVLHLKKVDEEFFEQ